MTHDKYDTDILKTLKSIDASLKSIAKSVQPVNTTVVIDNNSEEAVKELKNKRFLPLFRPVQAVALGNKKICFLFNREVGLIELVEK